MTSEARKYQLDKQMFFTGKIIRGAVEIPFKYCFVDDNLKDVQDGEHIHGFWSGSTSRVIETVDNVNVNTADVIDLGNGRSRVRVASFKTWFLNPKQLRFVTESAADRVTRITLAGAGNGGQNV